MLQQNEKMESADTKLDLKGKLKESMQVRVTDIKKAIELSEHVYSLGIKQQNKEVAIEAKVQLAFFSMIKGDYQAVERMASQADTLLSSFGEHTSEALLAYTRASVYYKTDNYHLGLKQMLASLNHYKRNEDLSGQAKCYKAIGSIYEFFKDFESAKNSYLQCITIGETIGDINNQSNAMNPLSGVYLKEGELGKAEGIINKSIALKKKSGDKRGLAFAIYGKGKVELKKKHFEKAELLFQESLSIHKELSTLEGQVMALNKLGQLSLEQQDVERAKYYFNTVFDFENKPVFHLIIYKAYFAMYQIFKNEGNIPQALFYLEQHNYHRNKVQVKEISNTINGLKTLSKVEILEKEAKWQQEKNREIQLKNEELDNFVYKVSHDLRGPITSLLGLYNVVLMDIKDKESLRYFDLYNKQIIRLNEIIIDFINLTRIKEMKLEPVLIDFETMVQECIDMYSYYPVHAKINFEIRIEPDLKFYSDKGTLNTIVQNLIENAVKYSRNDVAPFVYVDIYRDKNESLNLRIKDNGIGISRKYQDKIFTMFFRANDITQGSGLGLYILKNAVEKLGGTVAFISEVHQGSSFNICLPYSS